MFDQSERLVSFAAPQCDTGAPEPVLWAEEGRLRFAYLTSPTASPALDPDEPVGAALDEGDFCAIVDVAGCRIFKFGSPNDEAIGGHRLAKIGLVPYSANEVLNSTWIAELERANRVHHRHAGRLFAGLRHFVFTFHDSTLEFVCRDEPKVRQVKGSPRTAMIEALGGSDQ